MQDVLKLHTQETEKVPTWSPVGQYICANDKILTHCTPDPFFYSGFDSFELNISL